MLHVGRIKHTRRVRCAARSRPHDAPTSRRRLQQLLQAHDLPRCAWSFIASQHSPGLCYSPPRTSERWPRTCVANSSPKPACVRRPTGLAMNAWPFSVALPGQKVMTNGLTQRQLRAETTHRLVSKKRPRLHVKTARAATPHRSPDEGKIPALQNNKSTRPKLHTHTHTHTHTHARTHTVIHMHAPSRREDVSTTRA